MLSESDKQFIKLNQDKDIDWLIEQTKRSKKDIEAYLQEQTKKNPLAERVRKQTSGKKGTTVMTGGVSGIADSIKSNQKDNSSYIHKIRPNE